MPARSQSHQITPERIFDLLQAYRNSAALKTAIDLDIFSHIGAGIVTAADLADELKIPVRGMRILCDFLTTDGLLIKTGDHYALNADAAVFLDRKSPAYMGGAARFLCSTPMMRAFDNLIDCVRRGGATEEVGLISQDHPVWVDFAHGMAALQALPAQNLSEFIDLPCDRPIKILDIAAGHGRFGIALAARYPNATVFALDWPAVLNVARKNADDAALGSRFETIAGSAFEVDLGDGYDAVLLVNFLHHFGIDEIATLFGRIRPALNAGGLLVIAGFMPNEDRISPPQAARFSLSVMASTPKGEAYTAGELKGMLEAAGFSYIADKPMSSGLQRLITAQSPGGGGGC
jgi:hypothetical protein